MSALEFAYDPTQPQRAEILGNNLLHGAVDLLVELGSLAASMAQWAAQATLGGDLAAAARVQAAWPELERLRSSMDQRLIEHLGAGSSSNLERRYCLALARAGHALERAGALALAGAERGLGASKPEPAIRDVPLDLELLSGLAQVMLDEVIAAFERSDARLASSVLGLATEIESLERDLLQRLLVRRGGDLKTEDLEYIHAAHTFGRLARHACDTAAELLAALEPAQGTADGAPQRARGTPLSRSATS